MNAFQLRPTGPLTSAAIKPTKKISMTAAGAPLRHMLLTEPAAVGAVLTVGEHCYRMRFGGKATFKAGRRWVATKAPAPSWCPGVASVSGAFVD